MNKCCSWSFVAVLFLRYFFTFLNREILYSVLCSRIFQSSPSQTKICLTGQKRWQYIEFSKKFALDFRYETKILVCFFLFFLFFFFAPWAYGYIISGAGVISGTPHPAVWDTHISSLQFRSERWTAGRFRTTRPPTVVGKACLITSRSQACPNCI